MQKSERIGLDSFCAKKHHGTDQSGDKIMEYKETEGGGNRLLRTEIKGLQKMDGKAFPQSQARDGDGDGIREVGEPHAQPGIDCRDHAQLIQDDIVLQEHEQGISDLQEHHFGSLSCIGRKMGPEGRLHPHKQGCPER